jgi:hypothetical protein
MTSAPNPISDPIGEPFRCERTNATTDVATRSRHVARSSSGMRHRSGEPELSGDTGLQLQTVERPGQLQGPEHACATVRAQPESQAALAATSCRLGDGRDTGRAQELHAADVEDELPQPWPRELCAQAGSQQRRSERVQLAHDVEDHMSCAARAGVDREKRFGVGRYDVDGGKQGELLGGRRMRLRWRAAGG